MRRAPRFWWRPLGLQAICLLPLGVLYGFLAGLRMKRPGRRATVPVICLGNLVVGGAGKTPSALKMADMLRQRGKSPVFLSRGYGGHLAGPVRVDLAIHGSDAVGDEALLLATKGPTIIARDRVAGAALAAQFGDVIVMDDGLQNPSLVKQFSFAVIDAGQGLGNGQCLPAGPLRAPLSDQWQRVDACLIIGEAMEDSVDIIPSLPVPVYHGRLVPEAYQSNALDGLKIYAFAGIGRPEKFFDTLHSVGALVIRTESFPDHHRYQAAEIEALVARAREEMLVPVTTAKDAVKIREVAPDAMHTIRVLDVTLALDEGDELINSIMKSIS